MQGKVEICGVNTARLPRLDSRETEELLRRAHAGDTQARDALISGNLRLVLSVIQKFSGRGENVDDLFQVGCVGLIKAIDNFDPVHEVKFSTYGVPMTIECRENINGAIFPTFYGEYRFFIMRFVLRYFVSSL
ncbi:MAG: sigma-70 family RNA polymerase sigma factor, partial [Ruminococcaceae bacterium]|nr:sigma-70 family RNA polymerase sigma factor [Oscillospiraceae bacterium]